MHDEVDGLRRRLLAQSYLFDDPGAYQAGVEDAINETLRMLRRSASLREEILDEREPVGSGVA